MYPLGYALFFSYIYAYMIIKTNKDKIFGKATLNFSNQLKFSARETISVHKQLFYETLETIRSSILIETKYTEEKIIHLKKVCSELISLSKKIDLTKVIQIKKLFQSLLYTIYIIII